MPIQLQFLERESIVSRPQCDDGYVAITGVLLNEHDANRLNVLAAVPYNDDWEFDEACWVSTIDWSKVDPYDAFVPRQ